MSDKTLKILLGIIAVNLTFQTVKDVGLFPTAYAQDDINLNKGDVHINSFNGLFASSLDGWYTTVLNVNYDSRSMTASIINNVTNEIVCVPNACNY